MTTGLAGEFGRALRTMVRRSGFGAATVAVLALGIAAVTTMFSTLNSVVLRPLPFDRADDLMWIYSTTPTGDTNSTSALDYFDYRSRFQAFESIAAYLVFQPTTYLFGSGEPEPVSYTEVSHNFFSTLGVRPALGRSFAEADESAGGADIVIVGHGFWQRRLDGRSDAVGRSISLDGRIYEVVGVMPADFAFPVGVDAWLPLRRESQNASGRGNNNFNLFGRLRSGTTLGASQAEGSVLAAQIAQAYPDQKKGWGLQITPMHEVFFGQYRPAMAMLMAAVLLLLLVTCANVSSLFLARGVSRQGELALRAALGASRARLAWHLLAESLTLAAVGGGAGLALAWGGIRGVRALAPAGIPRVDQIGIDGTVAVFTAGVCVLAGLVAGLAPAVRGRRISAGDALRREARVVSGGSSTRLRNGLVVVQVALSLVLLIGAGLLVKGFLRMQHTDVGFDSSSLLLASVRPPNDTAERGDRLVEFYRDLTERLRAVPGVSGVALGEQMPFAAGGAWNRVFAGERPLPPPNEQVGATRRRANDTYFAALGVRILQGRAFAPTDVPGGAPVVIVNQALATRLWPRDTALGKTLVLPWSPAIRMEVVGIAADVREFGPTATPRPTFYLPMTQLPPSSAQLAVRTSGDPMALVSLVKQAARAVGPSVAVSAFETMDSRYAARTAAPRFRVALLTVFAALSLVMAATGLYGLLAYFVAQRARELGIRLALGAHRHEVVSMVLGRAAWLAGTGIALGLAGAVALSGAMRSLAYQVSATDAPTFVVVAAGLALVALAAGLVPAWRASSVDPARVLRSE